MSTIIVGKTPTQPETKPALRRLRRGQVIRGVLLLALIAVVVLTAFGEPLWQILGTGILLLSFVVVVLLLLAVLVITLLVAAITRQRTRILPWLAPLGRFSLVFGILLVGMAGAVVGSQWHASTPPILGADGKPLPGSIATMEQVTLNGSQQWITIRSKNVHNPVLLFLTGGPGQSAFPDNQMTLARLEDHFVVVNWDQPGTGKSYGAVPIATLTPQRYVEDAHALVQQLRTRFHQNKIYVIGASWGTILGIRLAQQYPELFYAYLGWGQTVNTTENDIISYQLALKYATERRDTATINTLRRNGPPPYVGNGMFLKYGEYERALLSYSSGINLWLVLLVPFFAPEYGLLDRVNSDRDFIETFTIVCPQLKNLDFKTQAVRLEVPVYFLEGHNDEITMASLVEQYYAMLQAPHKELIWTKAGHGVDSDQLVDVLVNRVLKQTWPGR